MFRQTHLILLLDDFVLTCSCFAELVKLKPGYRVLCDAILSNLYLDPASQLQKQLLVPVSSVVAALWNLAEMLVLQHLKEDMQQLDWAFP